MAQYKERIADKLLEYRLEEMGAVLIEGPKWCELQQRSNMQAVWYSYPIRR